MWRNFPLENLTPLHPWEIAEMVGEKAQVSHDGSHERGVRDGFSDLKEEIQLGWTSLEAIVSQISLCIWKNHPCHCGLDQLL